MPELPAALTLALADRYRLERELGAGGMATVYLAEDLKHQRPVAVKVLRPDLAASLGAERFLREIRIAARLSHPHILPLHDSGEAAGFLYYVMPYVEGISLRQKLVREGELPVPEAIRILRDLADAMTHAHGQGVVHRDIKPENVMLVERHALVMDFGVAKAVVEGKDAAGAGTLTSAGVALGTPAYMAPEQATGDAHVDARADVYAWGVVAYELLAGQPPFVRATPQATLAAHVTATAEPVTTHRPTVPGALAGLVMQCLEKRAADRPQTAAELVTRLEAVLTPSGGLTPTDTQPYQTAAARRAQRRRGLQRLGAVVGVAVLGLVAWRLWPRPAVDWIGAPRAPVAVLPFEVRGSGAASAELGQDMAEQVILALEQASLGPVARSEGEARTRVTGLITQRGDSIEVLARVIRAGDGETIWTLGPDRAIAADPTPAVVAIRERILGAIAAYLDAPASVVASRWSPPPTLELALLHDRAGALFTQGKWMEAEPLYREAFAKDTTWLAPLFQLSASLANVGRDAEADSVIAYLAARRGRLTPVMGLVVDAAVAENGPPEDEYRAQHALYRADSLSPGTLYNMMRTAERTRRPREALAWYARRDTASAVDWVAWDVFAARSHHMLGEFAEELALARAAKARAPAAAAHWTREVAALGALGHADSVELLIAASAVLENPNTDGILMRAAATELGAHGYQEAANRIWERYLAEYAVRFPEPNRSRMQRGAWGSMGRYDEVVRSLRQEAPAGPAGFSLRAQAMPYAVLAGDTTGALAMVDSLRTGRIEAGQGESAAGARERALVTGAQILGQLGRQADAVAMLRQALNSGYRLSFDFGLSPLWAPLRDYPPFRALAEPRG